MVKIRKAFGYMLYLTFAKWLPNSKSFFKLGKILRGISGKLILDKCGKNVNIERKAIFSNRCTLGDNSGIGINCQLGVVFIGNNVMMGPDCVLLTSNHAFDRLDMPMNQQGFQNEKPIVIDDDVWIGQRVIILPGVHVFKGAIIGAGSVVTKDVNEYEIVGGNPARFLRSRKVDNENGNK